MHTANGLAVGVVVGCIGAIHRLQPDITPFVGDWIAIAQSRPVLRLQPGSGVGHGVGPESACRITDAACWTCGHSPSGPAGSGCAAPNRPAPRTSLGARPDNSFPQHTHGDDGYRSRGWVPTLQTFERRPGDRSNVRPDRFNKVAGWAAPTFAAAARHSETSGARDSCFARVDKGRGRWQAHALLAGG